MLRTALKPQWLGFLLLALAVSTVFVLLSRWQLDQSVSNAPPPLTQTETAVPLTEHLKPGEHLIGAQADQMVTFTGELNMAHTVQVGPRLNQGNDGVWLVSLATIEGAPGNSGVPVVWGWIEEPLSFGTDFTRDQLGAEVTEMFTSALGFDPNGTAVHFTGRLLPADGPSVGGTDRTHLPFVSSAVSTAELVNVWDYPLYAGYLTNTEMTLSPSGADQTGTVFAADGTAGVQPVEVEPQPQDTEVVWLNIFYAVEWIIFAVFALYLWGRFVRDDYLKDQREAVLDEEWAEQWRLEELQRRREEARRIKAEATAAYRAYHQENS